MLQIQNILSYLNKILSDNVTIEDHSDLLLKMSSDANNYIKSSAFFNNKVQKCFIHHICNNIGCGSQKIRACNNIRSTDILNEIISNDNTMLDVLVFSWDSKTSLIEDKTVFIKYQDLLKHASWSGSRDEIKNAYNLSKISFYSLKTDLFKKRHIEHLLLELLKKSSMQNLFKSHKETYGISYLLYALVELCRVDLYNDFANHLKEIS